MGRGTGGQGKKVKGTWSDGEGEEAACSLSISLSSFTRPGGSTPNLGGGGRTRFDSHSQPLERSDLPDREQLSEGCLKEKREIEFSQYVEKLLLVSLFDLTTRIKKNTVYLHV